MSFQKRTVAVLMATHNGIEWLPEQIESILLQKHVDIRLIISDDASSDGSLEWLINIAEKDYRVSLLPDQSVAGGAGPNFYRLIRNADIRGVDYIAFADQDDIWLSNKLFSQINLIDEKMLMGCSSSVVAFWADGSRLLVDKARPMVAYDYVFESAGPGCSFVIKPDLFYQVREILLNTPAEKLPEIHDWLIYATCRALDEPWFISSRPTLLYRQHKDNVVGVNAGFKAGLKRIFQIKSGHYRREVQKIASIASTISKSNATQEVIRSITRLNIQDRVKLLSHISQLRRHTSEQWVLAIVILGFIF